MTIGETKHKVERPNERRYTKHNNERVDTDTRGVLMGGQKRSEEVLR
jgi:hypothetical protein